MVLIRVEYVLHISKLKYLSKYRVNKRVDRTVPYFNYHNPTCTQVGVLYMIINCIQYPGSDKTMQLLTRESLYLFK